MSTPSNPLWLVPQVTYAVASNNTCGLVDDSHLCTLEDVHRSFIKMAPEAFEFSEIDDPESFWNKFKFSESQLVDLWGKIWDTFDFHESQYIDVKLLWNEQ